MASYTSWRCTEISIGAAIPNRTLSPRISTTVMTISSPMMILSSRCRDRTSIVFGSFLLPARPATLPARAAYAHGDQDGAGDGTSPVVRKLLSSKGYAVARNGDGPGSTFGAGTDTPVSRGYRTGYRLEVRTSCRARRRIGLNTSGPWRLTVSP